MSLKHPAVSFEIKNKYTALFAQRGFLEISAETEKGEFYETQFAWDKQASFLSAQSRAMTTLQNMIKNYDELVHKNWEMATEEQKARIEVLKNKVGSENNNDDNVIAEMLEGLKE